MLDKSVRKTMDPSEIWSSVPLSDPTVLLGAMALIVGGVTLVASSIPVRAELIARRVEFAFPPKTGPASQVVAEVPPPWLQQLPSFSAGLSEAEQRLIIKLLSKLHVRASLALVFFVGIRLVMAFAFGTLTLTISSRYGVFASSWALRSSMAVGAAIVGGILPSVLLAYATRRRAKLVALGLPDALELLVVCVEAGLSLEDGLHRVSRELEMSQPALADELALTWAEIYILPSRTRALANFADRVDNPSVRGVINILAQSLELGTPLAQSLRVGATEMRNDQMLVLEERASRLPALLTIPVMIFVMPTIFLIVGGPATLRLIDMFLGGAR